MARQIINVGASANDGTGDGLRTAFVKSNENFAELYGNSVTPTFLSNGTSNIGVVSSDGNVTVSIANLANVAVFSQTSLELSGNLDANGNVNASSLSLTGSVSSNLVPVGSGVLNLGSDTNRWGDLFLTGSTITLGDIVLKDNGSNILGVFGADGTTPGTINLNSVDTTSIGASGNITAANIVVDNNVTANGFFIGDGGFLSNVTAVSNVAVSQIANGSSILSIAGADGNIVGTSGGTTVLTIPSTGANVNGYVDATGDITAAGNISGQFILGNGSQLTGLPAGYSDSDVANLLASFGSNTIVTTGNISAGNIISAGVTVDANNISANGTITATEFVGDIKGSVFADDSVLLVDAVNNVVVADVDASSVAATTGTFTNISGNITTASQTQITSVGTLTGLTMGGNIVMVNNSITGLPTPNDSDEAATKGYVDSIAAEGIHYHPAVRLEQPGALTVTYDNGTGGVGATLTNAAANAALVIDGVSTQVNDRVLIYEQANAVQNGIYDVTTVGNASTRWVMTRSSDADSFINFSDQGLGGGDAVFVQEGDTGAGEVYEMSTTGNITIGTTDINWVQIKAAQVYSAADGVDLTGTVFSLDSTYSATFAGLTVPSITKSGSNGVGNIGQSGNSFNTVFAKATSAQYADVAEMYSSDTDYEPGTVVQFGGNAEVTIADTVATPLVAGVVSTNPAYLMNSTLQADHSVAVALLGRVPTRVRGKVRRGQMLVSDRDGFAVAQLRPEMGTVVGKAVEDFDGDEGVIEVVVGRL